MIDVNDSSAIDLIAFLGISITSSPSLTFFCVKIGRKRVNWIAGYSASVILPFVKLESNTAVCNPKSNTGVRPEFFLLAEVNAMLVESILLTLSDV